MSEYVDVDIIENGKVIGTTKILKKTEEPEEQKIKLEKVDDKAAYENLLIKCADLVQENAELKKKIGIYQKGMYDEIEKRDKKLTKATELIEDMYDKIPSSHSDYYKDVMERARQFLWG